MHVVCPLYTLHSSAYHCCSSCLTLKLMLVLLIDSFGHRIFFNKLYFVCVFILGLHTLCCSEFYFICNG
jgi:hypothetical protein